MHPVLQEYSPAEIPHSALARLTTSPLTSQMRRRTEIPSISAFGQEQAWQPTAARAFSGPAPPALRLLVIATISRRAPQSRSRPAFHGRTQRRNSSGPEVPTGSRPSGRTVSRGSSGRCHEAMRRGVARASWCAWCFQQGWTKGRRHQPTAIHPPQFLAAARRHDVKSGGSVACIGASDGQRGRPAAANTCGWAAHPGPLPRARPTKGQLKLPCPDPGRAQAGFGIRKSKRSSSITFTQAWTKSCTKCFSPSAAA